MIEISDDYERLASPSKLEVIRLAIVGSGSIAKVHAEAISQISNARLVAVCGTSVERARVLASPYGATPVDSIGWLVQAQEVDAVLIATPTGMHSDATLPLLKAGKSVLCEKPLEINTERVRAMIHAARMSGAMLAGFFPLRSGRAALAIKKALAAGRFGRLTYVSARVKWWRSQEYYQNSNWRGTWSLDGGGALMNQGIHAVDLLQWFGGEVAEVSAASATLVHPYIEVEDTLAAVVRFKNGAMGTIEAATSCFPGFDLSLEVSGDAGSVILINGSIERWQFRDRPAEEAGDCGSLDEPIGGGTSDPLAISHEGHRRQIEDFCSALQRKGGDTIDGRQAGIAVAIIESIYRSARSGKFEAVVW